MATKLKRIVFYAQEHMVGFLEHQAVHSGISIGEAVRRAVDLAHLVECQAGWKAAGKCHSCGRDPLPGKTSCKKCIAGK
jgi:hypothetical protein